VELKEKAFRGVGGAVASSTLFFFAFFLKRKEQNGKPDSKFRLFLSDRLRQLKLRPDEVTSLRF